MLGNAFEWVDYVFTGYALDVNDGHSGAASTSGYRATRGPLTKSKSMDTAAIIRRDGNGALKRDQPRFVESRSLKAASR